MCLVDGGVMAGSGWEPPDDVAAPEAASRVKRRGA